MSTQSDDIERANAGARAEWEEFERQQEAKMQRDGLVWCPTCDGTGCHPDDARAVRGDACPTCNGAMTVAQERVGATVLH